MSTDLGENLKFEIFSVRNVRYPADNRRTISMEVVKLTTKEALNKIHELGFPISVFAKAADKAPSTLQKWANGSSKYLAEETEELVRKKIIEIKDEIMKIEL